MQVIEENSTNWLVATDNGTDIKTKSSDLNKLLYGHDLFGLIDDETEIWTRKATDEHPRIRITPQGDGIYALEIGNAPELILGKHHKTKLVEAMAKMYEDRDGDPQPIINLFESIRADMIREEPLAPFLAALSSRVEEREDGWFINGHLLLTYENSFYHSENVSRTRSGSVIGTGTTTTAYRLDISADDAKMNRVVETADQEYRLTDKEVVFLMKATWAVENTSDRR
jgi:hypothetical protein